MSCEVEGCEKRTRPRRRFCSMHAERLRLKGAVGTVEMLRRGNGEGHITWDGYVRYKNPDHPLASPRGFVQGHRQALFDAIGPGPHPCHWCGKALHWTGVRQSRKVQADHLNHDRLDNDPANLVPACLDCNTKRRAVTR